MLRVGTLHLALRALPTSSGLHAPPPFWLTCSAWEPYTWRSAPSLPLLVPMLRLPSGSHAPRGNPFTGAPRPSLYLFWFPCTAWEPFPWRSAPFPLPLLVPMLCMGTSPWSPAPIPTPSGSHALRGNPHLALRANPIHSITLNAEYTYPTPANSPSRNPANAHPQPQCPPPSAPA